MKNNYPKSFDSIIKIKIEGKNINNYIKRIIKSKIKIIKLIPVSQKELYLILPYKEYKKIIKYKSIYNISIINTYGVLKLKNKIKKNIYLIFSILICINIMFILSKTIFSITIIHEDKSIRNLIKQELSTYGIKKYSFKKKYKELEKIENAIIKKNKDKLEWIEIIENGTNYTIKIEERKTNKKKTKYKYQSIISKKTAVITKINAISGEKIKTENEFIKKGETIISGYITLPDNTTKTTMAKGTILGEVWYKIKLDYPFVYQEENLTGKSKNVYVLNFFNKRISLFDFKKYKSFTHKDKIIFSNFLKNVTLTKEKQYELIVKDEVYPEDIAITKAKDYIKRKIKNQNPDIKKISNIIIISQKLTNSKIKLKLFISTIEDIGEIQEIKPLETQKNQQIR